MNDEKCCATCEYWKRDGANGTCHGGDAPGPQIMEQGKTYQVVWPRTDADNLCRRHSRHIEATH